MEGQSFLCMSLSVGTVNQVARQLTIPSLFFYDWTLPEWSLELFPALSLLLSTGAQSHSTCHNMAGFRIFYSALQASLSALTVRVVCSASEQGRDLFGRSRQRLLTALTCAGPQTFYQPMALSFTTMFGEQLLAFHKPTTPLQAIALYENVMEPGLRAGMTLRSSQQYQSSCVALLDDSTFVPSMQWCMMVRSLSAETVFRNHQSIQMDTKLAARAGLEVQSWLNGWNPLPSSCPPQSVYESLNIRHVYIREAGRGWNTTVDHSKWAITIPETSSRTDEIMTGVCIGDMNRMQAQSFRGGGAVCFTHNPTLWQMFRSIVAAIEGCSPPAPA